MMFRSVAGRKVRRVGAAMHLYVRSPERATEVARWVRDRKKSALDAALPWWPYSAIDHVDQALPPNPKVLEFGGGGSTLWLEARNARTTTIEHDKLWHELLKVRLGNSNCRLLLREPQEVGTVTGSQAPGWYFDDYVDAANEVADGAMDLAIIDGRARVKCGLAAMSKVRAGGMLLLDDSDRPKYRALLDALNGWRRIDYVGLKPGGGGTCQSSVWTRLG